jgi:hypothetical protein
MPPLMVLSIVFDDIKEVVGVFISEMEHDMVFPSIVSESVANGQYFMC